MTTARAAAVAGMASGVGAFKAAATQNDDHSANTLCSLGAEFLREVTGSAPPEAGIAADMLVDPTSVVPATVAALLPPLSNAESTGPHLRSIFAMTAGATGEAAKLAMRRRSADAMFPAIDHQGCDAGGSSSLWNGFRSCLEASAGRGHERWHESMMSALLEFAWCVPVDPTRAHISVHDFAVLAGAVCAARAVAPSAPLMFVTGDISGIQDYIFDIKTDNVKGGARLLRARSFEIQALAEAGARVVCDAVGLPVTQVIVNAGGRFMLILPDTPEIATAVEAEAAAIETWCARRYTGQLTLVVSSVGGVRVEDLGPGRFGPVFASILEHGTAAKRRQAQRYLRCDGDWDPTRAILDHDYDLFAGDNACRACGVRPIDRGLEDEHRSCQACADLAEVGQRLPHAGAISWTRGRSDGTGDGGGIDFFDGAWSAATHVQVSDAPSAAASVRSLSSFAPGSGRQSMLHRLPVNVDGVPRTFEDMVESGMRRLDGRSQGSAILGMLKADADRMGELFTDGLGDIMSCLSYMALSRAVDEYFTDVLQQLLKQDYPDVYAVFGGGDDLCLIGPWEDILSLAPKIAKRFQDYAGEHPRVHLSAGIALVGPHAPVPAMAREAEHALEFSKGAGRNRVTILGVTLRWDEWSGVADWDLALQEGLSSRRLSRGFVRSLLGFREAALAAAAGHLVRAPWRAHLRYAIGRHLSGGDTTDIRHRLERLAAFGDESTRTWEWIKIPISMVLYRTRQGGDA